MTIKQQLSHYLEWCKRFNLDFKEGKNLILFFHPELWGSILLPKKDNNVWKITI